MITPSRIPAIRNQPIRNRIRTVTNDLNSMASEFLTTRSRSVDTGFVHGEIIIDGESGGDGAIFIKLFLDGGDGMNIVGFRTGMLVLGERVGISLIETRGSTGRSVLVAITRGEIGFDLGEEF